MTLRSTLRAALLGVAAVAAASTAAFAQTAPAQTASTDPKPKPTRQCFRAADVNGFTAVDDKTLKVELDVPVSYFESLMYFPTFYPVDRAFYNGLAAGTFGTSPDTVLSNGAFKLDSYEPAALSFSLVKNPDYYAADSVKLDGLNYQVIKDSQQAFLSYQNGDLDIVKLSGDQVDQVQGDPELNVVGAGYMWYLTMNGHDVPALNNANMRLALSNAVNRASIVSDVVKDGSVATYTAVPPQLCRLLAVSVQWSATMKVTRLLRASPRSKRLTRT